MTHRSYVVLTHLTCINSSNYHHHHHHTSTHTSTRTCTHTPHAVRVCASWSARCRQAMCAGEGRASKTTPRSRYALRSYAICPILL
eukprot:1300744-Rhodomonas_salina.1